MSTKMLANVFSIIAMTLMFLSYQKMSKKDYLKIQIFSNLFFDIQYYLLNVKTILFSVAFFTIRSIVFYEYEKRSRKIPKYVFLCFMFILIPASLYAFFNHPNALITILIGALTTYGLWQKDLKKTYFIAIISACLWTCYNFTVGAYLTNIINAVEIIAAVIGIFKIKSKENSKIT